MLLNKWFDDGSRGGGRAHVEEDRVQGVAFQTSHTREYRYYTIAECVEFFPPQPRARMHAQLHKKKPIISVMKNQLFA